MDIIDMYFKLRDDVYNYFNFTEDWVILPLMDYREYYWTINDKTVIFGDKDDVVERNGNHCEEEIYTQRFYDKWVYESEKYTMIFVDTHCDGNKWFSVFDNSKNIQLTLDKSPNM